MTTKFDSTLSAADATSRIQIPDAAGAFGAKRLAVHFSGLLLAAVLPLLPSQVEAQCSQWDMSGQWIMQQSNGYGVRMDLRQSGKTVTGNARYTVKTKGKLADAFDTINPLPGGVLSLPDDSETINGTVSGSIEGEEFSGEIRWAGKSTGVYHGRVSTKGRIEGTAYDKKIPSRQATWFGSSDMKCRGPVQIPSSFLKPKPKPKTGLHDVVMGKQNAPVTGPPLGSPVIESSGQPKVPAPPKFTPITKLKVAPPPTTPDNAAPLSQGQSSGAPMITASPKVVTGGSTTLRWDGGSEHPYAEVWVGINGQDPTFVVEQGKGSRKVTAESGKTYLYILTDSGQQLATVTVKGQ